MKHLKLPGQNHVILKGYKSVCEIPLPIGNVLESVAELTEEPLEVTCPDCKNIMLLMGFLKKKKVNDYDFWNLDQKIPSLNQLH